MQPNAMQEPTIVLRSDHSHLPQPPCSIRGTKCSITSTKTTQKPHVPAHTTMRPTAFCPQQNGSALASAAEHLHHSRKFSITSSVLLVLYLLLLAAGKLQVSLHCSHFYRTNLKVQTQPPKKKSVLECKCEFPPELFIKGSFI